MHLNTIPYLFNFAKISPRPRMHLQRNRGFIFEVRPRQDFLHGFLYDFFRLWEHLFLHFIHKLVMNLEDKMNLINDSFPTEVFVRETDGELDYIRRGALQRRVGGGALRHIFEKRNFGIYICKFPLSSE